MLTVANWQQSNVSYHIFLYVFGLSSRYIGVIKNVIESYSKDVNVPSGQKIYESKLEGGIEAVGAAIIEKHAYVVCRQLAQSATGGYVGYVAVHVEMSDLQKGLSEELEVRKVDYDADKLMKEHEAAVSKSMSQKRNLKWWSWWSLLE